MFNYQYLILFIVALSGGVIQAQLQSTHWYFGRYAGLGFSSGGPQIQSSASFATEGCASISDECGNLLFYTDGRTVRNRNHYIMPNGFGLRGHDSSTQSALIVPNPENSDIYYIFTVNGSTNTNQGMYYSIVDMSLNNGNGDIIPSQKNIPLSLNGIQGSSEKLSGVAKADGSGYWVITHYLDSFYAFSVTSEGVNANPVTSSVGINIPVFVNSTTGAGAIKFSPNGNTIAVAHYSSIENSRIPKGALGLYDFDNETGIVSNETLFYSPLTSPDNRSYYGVEFSPNGNVLYANYSITTQIDIWDYNRDYYLAQYDLTLSVPNAGHILSSNETGFGMLQRAMDNKIYLARPETSYLSVINYPNQVFDVLNGTDPDFRQDEITLGQGISMAGLPNFIASVFNDEIYFRGEIASDEEYCFGNEVLFYADFCGLTAAGYHWDFGDGNTSIEQNPHHVYENPGVYNVTLVLTAFGGQSDTFIKEVEIKISEPLAVLQDTILTECGNNETAEFDLTGVNESIIENPESYIFSYHENFEDAVAGNNPLGEIFQAPTGTIVHVRVANESGCINIAEITLIINPVPDIPVIASPVEYCRGSVPEPLVATGTNLLWYETATGGTGNPTAPLPDTTFSGTIVYYVSQTVNGCESLRAEIIVTVIPLPELTTEDENPRICSGTSTGLSVISTGQNVYWYDTPDTETYIAEGTTFQTPDLFENTTYWMEAVNISETGSECSERLEITVEVIPVPAILIEETEAVCEGNAVILEAVHDGDMVYWYAEEEDTEPLETGHIFETPVLYGTVTYWVEAVNSIDDQVRCTSGRIPVEVEVIPLPELSIEPYEDEICEGETTTITVTTDSETVYWYDDEYGEIPFHTAFSFTTPALEQSVIYWVEAVSTGVNACISVRIPVEITVNPSPEIQETDIIYECDSLNDGFEFVDLTQNNITNNPGIILTYYANPGDLANNSPIDDPQHFPINSSPRVVYVSAAAGEEGCPAYAELTVILTGAPAVSDTSLEICSSDGFGIYELTDANENIISGSVNYEITYHLDEQEAKNGTNPLPDTYENVSANQTVFARVESGEDCFNIAEILLTYNKTFVHLSEPLEACDEDRDGSAVFNLTEKEEEIESVFGGSGYIIIYYTSLEDAYNNIGEILNQESYTNQSNPQTVYAKVYDGDICLGIVSFDLIAIQLPEVEVEKEITLCPGENYTIETPPGYESYTWTDPNGIVVSTTNSAILDTEGTYILEITFSDNICIFREEIEVVFDEIPVVTNIEVNGTMVIVTAVGIEPLEYSMDGGQTWQSSNVFYDVAYGEYEIIVKSVNGCLSGSYPVVVFELTNIITPNNDGHNDTWEIPALVNYPGATLKIVDRYGKILVSTNLENGFTWDGKYNGNPSPSTGYWYVLDLGNEQKITGQVTVKNY